MESVNLKLNKQEALVLENSCRDMINYYYDQANSVFKDPDMAQPYKNIVSQLRESNGEKVELFGGLIDVAQFALKNTDNGKGNPEISQRLLNRIDGMAVEEDFRYYTERVNKHDYVCRVYYKDEPIHAFGTSGASGRADWKSMSENAEATIRMKMAEINKEFDAKKGDTALDNRGLREIYEVEQDKALEREYNLYATAYLTFNDDNKENLDNNMMFDINITIEQIRTATIDLLRDADNRYNNAHSEFYTRVYDECPCLTEYAQQAVLSEVSQEKVYVVHEQVGNFSVPRKVCETMNDVQDYMQERFEASDLNTGKEDDEQLFFSYYNIQETTVGKLNEVFKEGNGTGYIISNEAISYELNETEGRPPFMTTVQCIKKDPTSERFETTADAARQAKEDGINLIPRKELPHAYKEYSIKPKFVLDTSENRSSIEDIDKHTNISLERIKERTLEVEKGRPSEKKHKRFDRDDR